MAAREGWYQDQIEVANVVLERLATIGCGGRQRVSHVSGLHAGEHRIPLRSGEIAGDPVHQRVTVAPELVGVHRAPTGGGS